MINSWNAVGLSDNKVRFHQKWVNNAYIINGKPLWTPIDSTLRMRSGQVETTNYPIGFNPPKLATGTCEVFFQSPYDTEDEKTVCADPQIIKIRSGISPVDGIINPKNHNQIIYKNAIEDGIDLIYGVNNKKSPTFEKIFAIRKMPRHSGNYLNIDVHVECPNSKIHGSTIDSIVIEDTRDARRKTKFSKTVAWFFIGGKKISRAVKTSIKYISKHKIVFTKHVPVGFIQTALSYGAEVFTDASLAFSPATSSGGTSTDGYADRNSPNSTFSSLMSDVGMNASTIDSVLYMMYFNYSSTPNLYNYHLRCYLTFATGSSLSGNFVSGATLSIYGNNKSAVVGSQPDCNFVICGSNLSTAAKNNVVAADYNNCIRTMYSDTIWTYDSWTLSSFNVTTFNNDGKAAISTALSGKTEMSIIPYFDYTSVEPTWGNYFTSFIYGNAADDTNDPSLSVTYYPTNPKAFLMF